MEATQRFQQALPYLFLSVSDPLSALHATRSRRHNPSIPSDPNACASCGSYLHYGKSQSRVARSKSRKSRVRRTTCLACGHVQTSPCDLYSSTRTPAFHLPSSAPDVGNAISSKVNVSTQLAPALAATRLQDSPRDNGERLPAPTSVPQTSRSGAGAGKITQAQASRAKKKTGLQAMLARNREQQEKERAKSQTKHEGGLSAFLHRL